LPAGKRAFFRDDPPVSEQENPWIEIAPGIKRRTIATGTSMYQMRAELTAGSRLPSSLKGSLTRR